MDGLDFFTPSEGGGGYDAAAFERFKEQIKANGQFIAAARKQEQKQKKKEDSLAVILLKFIQNNQKGSLVYFVTKLLAENMPASFILAVIVLGNKELKAEADAHLKMLAAGQPERSSDTRDTDTSRAAPSSIPTEFSLITRFADESIPLKIKVEIDEWGKGIFEAGSAAPFRVLETATDNEGHVKRVLIDCTANVLDDFLKGSGGPDFDHGSMYSFCEFFIKGVMKQLKKQVEDQKLLG